MPGHPPVAVQQFGQSIWLDNISRHLLESGELRRLIAEDGVLGVTSNPTIFQRAISGSSAYDDAIMTMLELDPQTIFERLAIADIQHALDLFRPVYERTGGSDGFVSLEVSPLIANDTHSTVEEARRLAAAVKRPNLMIKIPATKAGIPAIEESIAGGININVTLLFSVSNYDEVAEAYIRGLERRRAAGHDITGLQSVASFFLSRIDAMVDRMIESNMRLAQGRDLDRLALNRRLKGRTAINNAKVAYRHFLDVFHGERFAALREAGAAPQRLLWASTGTKNPAYPDTMYVDSLIGAETVNTVPPETLAAFSDHGTAAPTLTDAIDEAADMLDMLAEAGIDLDKITQQLQNDGVEAFIESYENLLAHVDAKRNVLATGVIRQQELALGIYDEVVQRTMADLRAHKTVERIWGGDGSLWKDDNDYLIAEIEDRLGWLRLLDRVASERLATLPDEIRASDFTHVVLLGMGGSSFAPEVLWRTFGQQDGFPAFHLLDSTDPLMIRHIESQIDPGRTLFVVSSKSGDTIETLSFFRYFYARTGSNGAQFIAITDPGTPLDDLARQHDFREVFHNPTDIGGPWSALSNVGFVPAALMGVDLPRLRASKRRMMKACGPRITGADNPALLLGAIMGAVAREGRDKLTIVCSPSIATFGVWIEQLVAQSTGKEGTGILPVVGGTVGKPHDYSSDRFFVYLRVADDDNASLDEAVRLLREAGHPFVTLHLDDPYALGGEFFRWELATAVAGKVLGVNPFDEPNVIESKENTARLLATYDARGSLPPTEPMLETEHVQVFASERMQRMMMTLCQQHGYPSNTLEGLLGAPINATEAGDYFALMAYLPVLPDIDEMLWHMQRRLRHGTRRAVTLGYGPRFLHSTGQFHKGGTAQGMFLQITCPPGDDLPIPGAAYTFGVLHAAEAAGDLLALQERDRRVVRLHLKGDLLAGLRDLLDVIEAAGERRQQ